MLSAIPEFLLNHARYRDWLEQETISDINQFTEQSFDTLSLANNAITQAIAANDPADDQALVRIMHRRSLRLSMIIAEADPDTDNPLFHILDPILS